MNARTMTGQTGLGWKNSFVFKFVFLSAKPRLTHHSSHAHNLSDVCGVETLHTTRWKFYLSCLEILHCCY